MIILMVLTSIRILMLVYYCYYFIIHFVVITLRFCCFCFPILTKELLKCNITWLLFCVHINMYIKRCKEDKKGKRKRKKNKRMNKKKFSLRFLSSSIWVFPWKLFYFLLKLNLSLSLSLFSHWIHDTPFTICTLKLHLGI